MVDTEDRPFCGMRVLFSVLLPALMITLATALLIHGKLLSPDYVVLILGSIGLGMLVHFGAWIKEIDIRGLRVVLREIKTERQQADQTTTELRRAMADMCDVAYASLVVNVHERVRFGMEVVRQMEIEEKRISAFNRILRAMLTLGRDAAEIEKMRAEMCESVLYRLKPILHEALYSKYLDESRRHLDTLSDKKDRDDFSEKERSREPYTAFYNATSGGPLDTAGVQKTFDDAGLPFTSTLSLLKEVEAFYDRHDLRAHEAKITGMIPMGDSRK